MTYPVLVSLTCHDGLEACWICQASLNVRDVLEQFCRCCMPDDIIPVAQTGRVDWARCIGSEQGRLSTGPACSFTRSAACQPFGNFLMDLQQAGNQGTTLAIHVTFKC